MYNSISHKTKQFFWFVIKLTIVVGCGYFIYQRLLENDELNFGLFYQKLIENDIFLLKNLLFLFLFTFLNWFLEILKWQKLTSFIKSISFFEAAKQCLASLTASLVTPNKIGEYGAKALYFENQQRKKIVGLNLVGNFYQLTATLFFGVIGFIYFVSEHNVDINLHRIFRAFLLGVLIISSFFFGAKHFNYRGFGTEKARQFIGKIPFKLNLQTAFFSFLRYLVFAHQFYILLVIFKIDINYINALSVIASVYFISSIVPMLTLFDVILKSSVAVWVFSYFSINVITIISITTLMWILNFVLPAIFGSYFVLTFKPVFTK